MRRYRFCVLDQFHQVMFADVFECADDGAAWELLSPRLSSFPGAGGFELWDLNRLVRAGSIASPGATSSAGDAPAEQHGATVDPPDLRAERLRAAYAYWLGKRNGRLMPSRSDIDATEIPRLLPYVMLIDVLAEPLDFRYRLIGTAARSISRRDYTGLRFSDVAGKGKDSALWRGCETVVQSKLPHSNNPPYVGSNAFVRNCENVLLPLSDDRISVTMIFKVISFEYAQSTLRQPAAIQRA